MKTEIKERSKNNKSIYIVTNELKMLSNNLTLDEQGEIFLDHYKLDPFFYPVIKVRWDLVLTFHYRYWELYSDNPNSEKLRNISIARLFRRTKEKLKLPSNDLQYFGGAEKQGSKVHTHTICLSKSGIDHQILINTFKSVIPFEMYIPNKKTQEKAIARIDDQLKLLSYISKINKNTLEIRTKHYSKDFIRFMNNCNMSARFYM